MVYIIFIGIGSGWSYESNMRFEYTLGGVYIEGRVVGKSGSARARVHTGLGTVAFLYMVCMCNLHRVGVIPLPVNKRVIAMPV